MSTKSENEQTKSITEKITVEKHDPYLSKWHKLTNDSEGRDTEENATTEREREKRGAVQIHTIL